MDAIVLRNVVKSFRKKTIRGEYTTFKSELVRWLRGKRLSRSQSMIETLRGVDLVVPQGRTVGILGRNGSGKSTLLKLITGIYAPTAGSIQVNGRVSALLDLGAGFHPDFSGRENILINGVILGMSREEVRARMEEIIAFSELGDFIDEPVRTYSSGMYMRLAFSVATYVDPDILIIDEILAVGDEHFGRKSRAKMDDFKRRGKTIVLVTHDLDTVKKWCDMAVWLDGGRVRRVGAPVEVVQEYKEAVLLAEARQDSFHPPALSQDGGVLPEVSWAQPVTGPSTTPDKRSGTYRLEVSRVLLTSKGLESSVVDTEQPLEVCIDFVCKEPLEGVDFEVILHREDGIRIYGTSTRAEQVALPSPLPEQGRLRLTLPRLGLLPGNYFVDIWVRSASGEVLDSHKGLHALKAVTRVPDSGLVRLPHQWGVELPAAEGVMQAAAAPK